MHITSIEPQNQSKNSDKLGIFGDHFSTLKIGSMLNKSGIIKTKGASPLELFTIVFKLAFIDKNFFEGVVRNKKIDIGKDAVYNLGTQPPVRQGLKTQPGRMNRTPKYKVIFV
jgi:hypothetical protein